MANCLRWLILFLFLGNVVFADENKVRCVVHGKLVGMEVEDVMLRWIPVIMGQRLQ